MNAIRWLYKAVQSIIYKIRCVCSTMWLKVQLCCNGVEYHRDVFASGGACPQIRISKSAEEISLGRHVVFNNFNASGWYTRSAIWVRDKAQLHIGDNSGINGALIYAEKSIRIGNNVRVGGGTRIMDTDFHPLDYLARRKGKVGTKCSEIIIEDDVLIGTACIILKGVTIGARSIVAAGAVVTTSIPPDEIWGGSPAKCIRKMKKEEIV